MGDGGLDLGDVEVGRRDGGSSGGAGDGKGSEDSSELHCDGLRR